MCVCVCGVLVCVRCVRVYVYMSICLNFKFLTFYGELL